VPLSPAQGRLLAFLARDSAWHDRSELGLVKLLEEGDADEVDALAEAGLVVVRDDAVCISPGGAAAAEQEVPPLVSEADNLRDFIASGAYFHGQSDE
jgi:hypothetical protein